MPAKVLAFVTHPDRKAELAKIMAKKKPPSRKRKVGAGSSASAAKAKRRPYEYDHHYGLGRTRRVKNER